MSIEDRLAELNSSICYLTEEIIKLTNSQGGVLQQQIYETLEPTQVVEDPSTELVEEVAKKEPAVKAVITEDEAREALKNYVAETSRENGKKLLEELGAKTFGKVDPKDYQVIIDALKSVED